MINCELQDVPKYSLIPPTPGEQKKKGRYHGSMFWDIPGYGSKKWVVATRIRLIDDVSGLTDGEIIDGCVRFLNTPPPRKKYQKKKPKPKYGNLELHRAEIKRSKKETLISALFVIGDRKNKNFWGCGPIGK